MVYYYAIKIGFEMVNAKFFRSLDGNTLKEDEQTKGN